MKSQKNTVQVNSAQISANARLHMGFYNLADTQFGSVGLSLRAPQTVLNLSLGAGQVDEMLKPLLEKYQTALNAQWLISASLSHAIPRHAGLGSGTQLALALGEGLNQLFGLQLNGFEMAKIAHRGSRSTIGLETFYRGGFVADAGRVGEHQKQPLARIDFPSEWRILLVIDNTHQGLHSQAERDAFASLTRPAHHLKALVENKMLPALQQADLATFGACITALQRYNADYFAPAQGGFFASQKVAAAMQFLQTLGADCIGQSSWGSAGFAILENALIADDYLQQLHTKLGTSTSSTAGSLNCFITQAANAPAKIELRSMDC